MSAGGWRRVTRSAPCPICGRGDWCAVSADGSAAICPRTESLKRTAGGYLHRLRPGAARPAHSAPPRLAAPAVDIRATAERARAGREPRALARFAAELGVSVEALDQLGIGRIGAAWTFPMRGSDGEICGVRLRLPDGDKLSVRGGREGLFIPTDLGDCAPLLICEGPTDTAAALSMGFGAIGRPSCTGGVKLAALFVVRHNVKHAVIVADGDEPGQRGARDLARELRRYVGDVRLIQPPPPHKDLRAWCCGGATRADVQRLIDAAEPAAI